MEQSAKTSVNTIPKVFQSMAYGENIEKIQDALDWLKSKNNTFFAWIDKPGEQPNGLPLTVKNAVKNETLYTIHVPEIETVTKILAKSTEKKWLDYDPFERTRILHRISTEIDKKCDLFAQLEVVTRGILARDTKAKAVPLLVQYFSYYSAFSFTSSIEKIKPYGTSVGVMSNDIYLAYFGLYLAPALAAGCNVILQVGSKLTPVAFLLQDIAKSAGLPDGTFKIIPSDDGELLPFFNSDKVDIVTLLVDINDERYRGINSSNKKLLVLTTHKTPVIICDSADIDSAVESVIESSWSYQSLLPWATDVIVVQENILKIFLYKLQTRLKSIKVSSALDVSSDISLINDDSFDNLHTIKNEATHQGIEVFQVENDLQQWTPTLLIGGKVKTNLSLESVEDKSRAVTVLPFRSIDEAVNLANNNKQGLWASVWSENIGIVNEVTKKIKVSNIFVNSCCGITSPDIVLTPIKDSGIGSFGGRDGFLEYLKLEKDELTFNSVNEVTLKSSHNIDAIVNSAKKAQETWQKVSKIQKQKIFQQFAEYLPSQTKNAGCPEQTWLASTVKNIYTAITDSPRNSNSSTSYGYQLTSLREPRGVIVIDKSENFNTQLILTSLFEGNVVILLMTENSAKNIFEFLTQRLPSGVLNLVPYDTTVIKKLAANKQISTYFGDDADKIFRCLSIRDSKNYRQVSKLKDDIYGKINYVKNIWSDIGKSSNFI